MISYAAQKGVFYRAGLKGNKSGFSDFDTPRIGRQILTKNKKRPPNGDLLVGMTGFEPATTRPPGVKQLAKQFHMCMTMKKL
jgi:hypothetical protein